MSEDARLKVTPQPEPTNPIPFTTVFEQEADVLKNSRVQRGVETDKPVRDTLIGLAFSGGGIRSATINLGLLQALARNQLLKNFDYLSTVSGGGYIGSWLAAFTRRSGFGEVQKALESKPYSIGAPGTPPEPAEHPAVRWLRNYSDYLTPHVGIFTGDAGAVAGSWFRNVLLNQLVLVLFLLSVVLLPSGFVLFARSVLSDRVHATAVFATGVGLVILASIMIARSMVPSDSYQARNWLFRNSVRVGLLPLLFAAALLINTSMITWHDPASTPVHYWIMAGALLYLLTWVLAALIATDKRKKTSKEKCADPDDQVVSWPTLAIAALVAGGVGGLLLHSYAVFCASLTNSSGNLWTLIVVGTVLVLTIMLLAGILQLGLLGSGCVDLVREWWARLGGSLMLCMMGWLLIFGIVVFGPLGVRVLLNTKIGTGINISALVAWVGSIVGGISAGKSAQTNGQSGGASKIMGLLNTRTGKEAVAKAAPYVFILGLLVVLSTAVHYVLGLYFAPEKTTDLWRHSLSHAQIWSSYWAIQDAGRWSGVFLAALGFLAVAAVLSWRVDVNDFSMHHFYRNRLVRCYLGASRNKERKPQPFTGFDPDDEISLASLVRPSASDPEVESYPGLYPILNGTLNVTRGGELGFQKRKAKPFIFTPLYCGYDVDTYLPTAMGRRDKLGHEQGVTLGTAMAISGAAVSPNMGFHTSPATAFFLTLFDVRLGWWMGNPKYPAKWKTGGPILGLAYLLSELLGSCDEKSKYVYLSDGAHFENLAIYELIKRRCRLIVACDCGEDGGYGFGDLMSAIEKSRTDFGVDVRIDISKIRPASSGRESENSYAVAKIHYGENDCGILIYVKASLPKDDPNATPENRTPADVISYAQSFPAFPHQSTGDQWFDEVQFESYRALGEYIGDLVIKGASLERKISAVLAGQVKSAADIDRIA